MKKCACCDTRIPDHAERCPHCRKVQPPRNWVLQATLVLIVIGAAAVWLFGGF